MARLGVLKTVKEHGENCPEKGAARKIQGVKSQMGPSVMALRRKMECERNGMGLWSAAERGKLCQV